MRARFFSPRIVLSSRILYPRQISTLSDFTHVYCRACSAKSLEALGTLDETELVEALSEDVGLRDEQIQVFVQIFHKAEDDKGGGGVHDADLTTTTTTTLAAPARRPSEEEMPKWLQQASMAALSPTPSPTTSESLADLEAMLARREKTLEARERAMSDREVRMKDREVALLAREDAVSNREAGVASRSWTQRDQLVAEIEQRLQARRRS